LHCLSFGLRLLITSFISSNCSYCNFGLFNAYENAKSVDGDNRPYLKVALWLRIMQGVIHPWQMIHVISGLIDLTYGKTYKNSSQTTYTLTVVMVTTTS
jgi:hypothetical protein